MVIKMTKAPLDRRIKPLNGRSVYAFLALDEKSFWINTLCYVLLCLDHLKTLPFLSWALKFDV